MTWSWKSINLPPWQIDMVHDGQHNGKAQSMPSFFDGKRFIFLKTNPWKQMSWASWSLIMLGRAWLYFVCHDCTMTLWCTPRSWTVKLDEWLWRRCIPQRTALCCAGARKGKSPSSATLQVANAYRLLGRSMKRMWHHMRFSESAASCFKNIHMHMDTSGFSDLRPSSSVSVSISDFKGIWVSCTWFCQNKTSSASGDTIHQFTFRQDLHPKVSKAMITIHDHYQEVSYPNTLRIKNRKHAKQFMKHTYDERISRDYWMFAIIWRRFWRSRNVSLRTSLRGADWGFTLCDGTTEMASQKWRCFWIPKNTNSELCNISTSLKATCQDSALGSYSEPIETLHQLHTSTLNPSASPHRPEFHWLPRWITDSCGSLVWKPSAPIVIPNHLQHFIWRYMKAKNRCTLDHMLSLLQATIGPSGPLRLGLTLHTPHFHIVSWYFCAYLSTSVADPECGAHTCLCRKIKDVLMTVGPSTVPTN